MDSRDLLLLIMTVGTLGVLAAVGYAMDDLRMRQDARKLDDIDRELEELIGGEK